MKKSFLFLVGFVLAGSCFLCSCGSHPSEPVAKPEQETPRRKVMLDLNLGQVGVLGRAHQMIPTRLIIRFESDTAILRDTIALSGDLKVSKEYELPLTPETLYVEGRDQRDSVLYRGTGTFAVQDTGTTKVAVSLDARYSSLTLRIPAIDSMTRLVVRVDNTTWTDSSISDTLGSGDILSVQRDYVPVSTQGTGHTFSLEVHGLYLGKDTILFAVDTSLGIVSGTTPPLTLPLHWVGPPRSGQVALSVTLGAVGQVNIQFVYDSAQARAIPPAGTASMGVLACAKPAIPRLGATKSSLFAPFPNTHPETRTRA